MEYIIICLLILVVMLLLPILFKLFFVKTKDLNTSKLELNLYREINGFKEELNKNNYENFNELNERIHLFELNINRGLGEFRNTFNRTLTNDFMKLEDRIEKRLLAINENVNHRLDSGFEKTNRTFTSILERLSKIDEAQKKIDSLSTDIVSLQDILTDKKARGMFGEVQLYQIMSSVFGERNEKIYSRQYKLSNGTLADAVLFAPAPLGMVAIDSKFPLENYRGMVDRTKNESERLISTKKFKLDMKSHIDAIGDKYIINGETSDQAIMFLPAEAIFAEINAYHTDVLEYANRKRVWIVSPTTLMSTLTTIQVVLHNIEKDKYTSIIHEELSKLSLEFARFRERWDKLGKNIKSVNKSVDDLDITTSKISNRFDSINNVELKDRIDN